MTGAPGILWGGVDLRCAGQQPTGGALYELVSVRNKTANGESDRIHSGEVSADLLVFVGFEGKKVRPGAIYRLELSVNP